MTQQSRIRTLDLIRGIAVLGILAINIASYAGPDSGLQTPNLPHPGSAADQWAFAFKLVFFEGKMRGLFAMLFGASMLLYLDRREATGRDGDWLQLRRLFWLGLFGLAHFILFWDGDILFLYACVGVGALLLRNAAPLAMAIVALAAFTLWHVLGMVSWWPSIMREMAVLTGTASPVELQIHREIMAGIVAEDRADSAANLAGFGAAVRTRLSEQIEHPLMIVAYNWAEALGYMLIGMALQRSGFFAGHWPAARLRLLGFGATGLGLAATLAFAVWAHPRGYPVLTMQLAQSYAMVFPHLLMVTGYAALLVMAAPHLLATRLGQRLEAAGKCAFTNYLGSTVLMTAIFSGWGLGLFGQFGTAKQVWFVLLGWAVMLIWSQPWLARYQQGPLEWLWRCLTEWQVKPLRRKPTPP